METNLNQCCVLMHSICDTCRKAFVCPMQHIEYREKCGLYEPLPNPLSEIINDFTTRSLYPIKEENNMEACKDRLKEEYAQTKERYEKLKAYNNKQEVEAYLLKDVAEEPEDMYSRVLLKKTAICYGRIPSHTGASCRACSY